MFDRIKNLIGLGVTIEALAEKFRADRVRLNLRPATTKADRNALALAVRTWAGRRAASITPEECKTLLARHGFYAARRIRAMWLWAIREGLLTVDPWARVFVRRRDGEKIIRYLAPADAHRYFAAVDPAYRAAIALGLWAGVRPVEISRLDWAQIHVGERRLKIIASAGKTGARVIEGVPGILWDVLASAAKEPGPIVRSYEAMIRARRRAALASGVELSADIFRHSFATYYVALRGDPGPAAKVLGHADLKMLRAHYDGVETKQNALAYFKE